MLEYRFYYIICVIATNIILALIIFPLNWIFGLVFLAFSIMHSYIIIAMYFDILWWPFYKWIDTDCVEIEKVDIPTDSKDAIIKAIIVRDKNTDRTKKKSAILWLHGFSSNKENGYRFAIPLALSGFVVLLPDARGHGETKGKPLDLWVSKAFKMDVKNELDFLENLEDVDKNRIMVMGHSMGGMMALSGGYPDDRVQKIVAISTPYDVIGMLMQKTKERSNFLSRFLKKVFNEVLKRDLEFADSEDPLEDLNKNLSPKYALEYESPIPDNERVYLVHCEHDSLIPFSETLQTKTALGLTDENVLILKKPERKYFMSSHNLTGQDTIILAFCIKVARSF